MGFSEDVHRKIVENELSAIHCQLKIKNVLEVNKLTLGILNDYVRIGILFAEDYFALTKKRLEELEEDLKEIKHHGWLYGVSARHSKIKA